MKYVYWVFGFVMLGIIGLVFIVMFQNITVNNESEYYVLKDAVEAAMFESIDVDYYRNYGEWKINEEKFVANCTRRFMNSINGLGGGFQLTFYDIMEMPPKVSVVATSNTDTYTLVNAEDGFDINNVLSAILEYDES